MTSTVDHSLQYKDVLRRCVCGAFNLDWILNYCDSCPDETDIKLLLEEKFVITTKLNSADGLIKTIAHWKRMSVTLTNFLKLLKTCFMHFLEITTF